MLVEREDVGEHLARVIFVGQAVDDRHARILGETLDDLLAERADHDDVDHARDDLRRVLDRLAASELRVARAEEHRVAAELEDAGFERETRARRILLEDHRERAVVQRVIRLVVLELALQDARAFEHVVVIVERKILELQIVANFFGGHETHTAASTRLGMSRTAPPSLVVSRLSIKDFATFDELAKRLARAPGRAALRHGASGTLCALRKRGRCGIIPMVFLTDLQHSCSRFQQLQRVFAARGSLAGIVRSIACDTQVSRLGRHVEVLKRAGQSDHEAAPRKPYPTPFGRILGPLRPRVMHARSPAPQPAVKQVFLHGRNNPNRVLHPRRHQEREDISAERLVRAPLRRDVGVRSRERRGRMPACNIPSMSVRRCSATSRP